MNPRDAEGTRRPLAFSKDAWYFAKKSRKLGSKLNETVIFRKICSEIIKTMRRQSCKAVNTSVIYLNTIVEFSSFLLFKFGWLDLLWDPTFNPAGSLFTALQFIQFGNYRLPPKVVIFIPFGTEQWKFLVEISLPFATFVSFQSLISRKKK